MFRMRTSVLVALVVFAATCGPDPNAQLPGYARSEGGNGGQGSGGVGDTGGVIHESGGAGGSGGRSTQGRGGATTSTGGMMGGSTGRADAGGLSASGGRIFGGADAASIGTGGRTTARSDAGGLGTGGATVQRDAATVSRDVATAQSCPDLIVSNDYACGSATSCGACKDNNGVSRTAECKKGIDCLAAAGASCDSNCQLGCLNQAGDSQVQVCIKALQTACSTSSCTGTPPPNGGG